MMDKLKEILPAYPRTLHLPWKANASRDDVIASELEVQVIFSNPNLIIEEKIDGSNCGMARYQKNAVIRNRDHILRKGYYKDTPAKQQFASIWTWFYDHEKLFKKLENLAGSVSVYGEWVLAQHGLEYDQLPSLFLAYDLYDYERRQFIASSLARRFLVDAGFNTVPVLHTGNLEPENLSKLETLCNQPSELTAKGYREGIYLKVSDGHWITHRFKMVRQNFVRGALWSETELKKNTLNRKKS